MKGKVAVIGPITKDKIIIKKRVSSISAGGCVFYCGQALSKLDIDTTAIITLSKKDNWLMDFFSKKIKIIPLYKKNTAYFENIYPRKNMDYRIQKAKKINNPIKIKDIKKLDFGQFEYIVIGALQYNDCPIETIKFISQFNSKICISLQGFLRKIENEKVILKNIENKNQILRYCDIAIMDENEAKIIIPNLSEIHDICKKISELGPNEVIITRGSKGSIVYSKREDKIYDVPAIYTLNIKDTTGAGDTFLAGYLAKRLETNNLLEVIGFAEMTTTIKLEDIGPLKKDKKYVENRLKISDFLKTNKYLKKFDKEALNL